MPLLKKIIIIIDITIFKRFALQRKILNFVIFLNRKCLKAISSVKKKSETLLVISFLLRNNLIHKVWIDLINERQHKTQGFLGKISESHGTDLSRGQWVLPETYNYLNPTELLVLLCCLVYPFGLWIYCGSIIRQQFLSHHWVLKKKTL